MRTGEKGKFGEALVLTELIRRGFKVSIPFGNYRYDFLVEEDGHYNRIQVKYVGELTRKSTITVVLHSISRKGRLKYSLNEIDFIVVFFKPKNSFYIIPYKDVVGKSAINLRVETVRNGQTSGIIPSSKYENRWDLLSRQDPD